MTIQTLNNNVPMLEQRQRINANFTELYAAIAFILDSGLDSAALTALLSRAANALTATPLATSSAVGGFRLGGGVGLDASGMLTGPWSTTATPADTVGPALTGIVTASAVTQNAATITWAAGTDAVGVAEYRYSTNGGGTYVTAARATTANLSGLSAGTTYALRVVAYDAAGNASNIIAGSLTTQAAVVADTTPPTISGTISATNVGQATATLTIPTATDANGIASYWISTNGGTTYISNGTSPIVNATGLSASATYSLKAYAVDPSGNQSAVVTGSVTMLAVGALALQPRFTVAIANSAVSAAFLAGMTAFGTPGNKGGAVRVDTAAILNGYGWVAVPASLAGSSVTFTSASAPAFPGGWDGALRKGAGGGATGAHQVVTDAGGQEWWVYRQDYPNANDGASADTWTIS